MQIVIQKESTGCGLACVATIANQSYQHVKSVADKLGINVQDPLLWSDTKYVQKLLAHYGLSPSNKTTPFKSWDTLPSLALLAIKWHKINDRAFWHWVIFWRGPEEPIVLDPKQGLQKNIRTDFGRIKPKWFLTVTIPRSHKIA